MAILAEKVKNKTLKVDTAKDLGTLIKAQDAAIRLEQLLSGEVDSLEGHKLVIEYVEVKAKPVESKEIENEG